MSAQESVRCPSFPQLSVVIASVHSRAYLMKCLDNIIDQTHDDIEIIVADSSCSSILDLDNKYPQVRFIKFNEKASLPVLWGAGIRRSSGEIIAITDSSCVVNVDWVQSILKAHQSHSPIIGGAVENSASKRAVDWAAYFCDYGQFMYPLTKGAVNVLPGNNISFKRWALEKGREYAFSGEFWKAHWCRKLQDEGIELMSEPSILVYYTKSYKLIPFLIRRFHHGRCFAGMRVGQTVLSKRAFYALGSIFLPPVLLYRTMAPILKKRRLLKEFFFSLPIMLLAIWFWSIGEMFGYVAGAGRSCEYIY